MKKRDFLKALFVAEAALGVPSALALERRSYGGTLRLSLPCNVGHIDPHDPHSLSSSLFGSSLFETLYQLDSRGRPYPTLATGLPRLRSGHVEVQLRGDLRFSTGRPLLAKDVEQTIRRSKGMSLALSQLPHPKTDSRSGLTLTFPHSSAQEVARLLSLPQSAIVPKTFQPTQPIGSGALRVKASGSDYLKLERNPICPRGGAFFDSVEITAKLPSETLRDFEAHRSHLALLGAGLHQQRRDAVPFQLSGHALILLEPGAGLRAHARPGILQSALEHLPSLPLSALGIQHTSLGARPWQGPPLTILVDRDEPWLIAIAEELSLIWSRPSVKIQLSQMTRKSLSQKRKSQDFDLILSALESGSSSSSTMQQLFHLDGHAPPRGGRSMAPREAARQLRLGVLGELKPSGAMVSGIGALIKNQRLDLANAHFIPTKRSRRKS